MSRVEEFVGCRVIEFADHNDSGNHLYSQWLTKESIVRCRDCKWFMIDPDPVDPGWPMMCGLTGNQMVSRVGFCAWGTREEL